MEEEKEGDNLDLVETHGIPKLIKEGKSFPFITIAPQCPLGTWWSDPEAIFSLSSLMDKIITSKIIKKSQIYCTGLSMGGYGTLALSIKDLNYLPQWPLFVGDWMKEAFIWIK